LKSKKIQGARIRSRTEWLKLGDSGSIFFFKSLKVKEARDKISSICEDGKCYSDSEDIVNVFS
jgi:hypothetical protein